MNLEKVIQKLRQQGAVILSLSADITGDESRWIPDPESWSILEVLNHLVDEEVFDFRRHLDHILHTPDQPWPEFDPLGWVKEKGYNQLALDKTLLNFKAEREISIAWLMALSAPDWDASVNLAWGRLTAGDMLASWLAHDLLHLRQLGEIRYQLTIRNSQPYSVDYAGKW